MLPLRVGARHSLHVRVSIAISITPSTHLALAHFTCSTSQSASSTVTVARYSLFASTQSTSTSSPLPVAFTAAAWRSLSPSEWDKLKSQTNPRRLQAATRAMLQSVQSSFSAYHEAEFGQRWSKTLLPALQRRVRHCALINKAAACDAQKLQQHMIEQQQALLCELIDSQKLKVFVSTRDLDDERQAFAVPSKKADSLSGDHRLSPYYCLDLASLLPLLALQIDPLRPHTVLDLCAAPGGKTFTMLQLLHASSTLTCNELSSSRRHRLTSVLREYCSHEQRASIHVTQHDGTQHVYERYLYDRILLDAPCSSDRHCLHDQSEMVQWTPSRSAQSAKRQKKLLFNALKTLKTGGICVYATCALSKCENDAVVLSTIKHYNKSVLANSVSDENSSDDADSDSSSFRRRKFKRSSSKLNLPLIEIIQQQHSFGEATPSGGWIVLPDDARCPGYGPLYFAAMRKIAPNESRSNDTDSAKDSTVPVDATASNIDRAHLLTASNDLMQSLPALRMSADQVTSLPSQVAGHKSGSLRMLRCNVQDANFILKPLPAFTAIDQRGVVELAFYEFMRRHCTDPRHASLVPFLSDFSGRVQIDDQMYLRLSDLTHGMRIPAVLDLKMGTRSFDEDASIEKQQHELAKASGAQLTTGFRLCGLEMQDYNCEKRWANEGGRERLYTIVHRFFCTPQLRQSAINQLKHLDTVMSEPSLPFRFYASSLLFVYDQAALSTSTETPLRMKLIDFAHSYGPHRDLINASTHSVAAQHDQSGFNVGLATLRQMLQSHEQYTQSTSSTNS